MAVRVRLSVPKFPCVVRGLRWHSGKLHCDLQATQTVRVTDWPTNFLFGFLEAF